MVGITRSKVIHIFNYWMVNPRSQHWKNSFWLLEKKFQPPSGHWKKLTALEKKQQLKTPGTKQGAGKISRISWWTPNFWSFRSAATSLGAHLPLPAAAALWWRPAVPGAWRWQTPGRPPGAAGDWCSILLVGLHTHISTIINNKLNSPFSLLIYLILVIFHGMLVMRNGDSTMRNGDEVT